MGVLRYGFVPKQPRLAILGTQILCLGTKLCLYELIFHGHLEEKTFQHILFYMNERKKNHAKRGYTESFKIIDDQEKPRKTMKKQVKPRKTKTKPGQKK